MRWVFEFIGWLLAGCWDAVAWLLAGLKGWRTLVVNLLLAVMPVLELSELANVLPDNWLPWYALIIALGNMALRTITTTPVGAK